MAQEVVADGESLDDGGVAYPDAAPLQRGALAGGGGEEDGEEREEEEEEEEEASVDVDVSGRRLEVPLLEESSRPRSPGRGGPAGGLYVYNNAFSLVPRSIARFRRLKILKFFGNQIDVLPPEAGELAELETLQVKVSWPGLSGIPFRKLGSLKELELCHPPTRPSSFSILTEVAGLTCLTKLSVCNLSLRYLPPEIGHLKKLEELDLSFNKLKSLPDDLSELSALKALKVANNKLLDLPSGLSCLPKLENLDLSNNRLTSLAPLELSSMRKLQYLNLQYNKLLHDCQVPSWIQCIFEENGEETCSAECCRSVVCGELSDGAIQRMGTSHSYNGSRCSSSTSSSETPFFGRCNAAKRMRKKWRRQNYFQQIARLERLNYSRKCKSPDQNEFKAVKSAEHGNPSIMESGGIIMYSEENKEVQSESPQNSNYVLENLLALEDVNGDGLDFVGHDDSLVFSKCTNGENIGSCVRDDGNDFSSLTSEHAGLNGFSDGETEVTSPSAIQLLKSKVQDEGFSADESKNSVNSKRHYDEDLDNPKRKCHRPFDGCSCLSCKYSYESFCGVDDHLPDGFYDAGRDRRCMPLGNYEHILCLDSREVILLDRETDEELDAIALSAKKLLSNLKRSSSIGENAGCAIDDLQRALMLALFVSDYFGGSDRSYSVLRMRHSALGFCEQRPFVCTCSTGNSYDVKEKPKQISGVTGNINFADLCDKSLRLTKEARNSVIVPIGAVRFGVCRHRAILMKYLCDRAEPPIPCELVRGYLDFMPHAWNSVLIRRGCSWMRMVVDACYPVDIREETDPEYFCRYIPLSRIHPPLPDPNSAMLRCSFPSLSPFIEDDKASSASVKRCKIGSLTAAAKVRNLETCGVSEEDIKIFEYAFLGEVRMLGALRKHNCIIEIYGHHFSSKWVTPVDGKDDHRILQSAIIMEYVKGGSLKDYLTQLSKRGEKHAPLNLALCIARDIACALVEVHSKHIIHRDIKSENILIDLGGRRGDGVPLVKLCDFDRAVPLHSFLHTCCIAHFGIHPPDCCVGTPRWMAPEVWSTMHERALYGLEVDIWSYGCLILELLTLKIPYDGLSDSEIQDLLQRKQRPQLTPELEEVFLSDDANCSRLESSYLDAEIETLKLLIGVFYRCTRGNPGERPTARQIYDVLCSAGSPPSAANSA